MSVTGPVSATGPRAEKLKNTVRVSVRLAPGGWPARSPATGTGGSP